MVRAVRRASWAMLPNSRLYRAIRAFAVSAPVWDARRIPYQTLPDERWDLTLVSQRVYGNRDQYLAVMAAAGLDNLDQPLNEQILVLPNEATLNQLKRAAGVPVA